MQADICVVVDSSGSINKADPGNWDLVKTFLKDMVSRLTIGPDDIRLALILFSNQGRVQFRLNELYTKVLFTDLYKLLDCVLRRWNAASDSDVLGLPVYPALL